MIHHRWLTQAELEARYGGALDLSGWPSYVCEWCGMALELADGEELPVDGCVELIPAQTD